MREPLWGADSTEPLHGERAWGSEYILFEILD